MSTLSNGQFNACVGLPLQSKRYIVLLKLGDGRYATTYLVRDTDEYYAAKVLTLEATQQQLASEIIECDVLEAIQDARGQIHELPILRDSFMQQGREGVHLCFVMPLLGPTVNELKRSSPSKRLYPYIVQEIVASVAEGLDELHRLRVVHTDLKPSNVVLSVPRFTTQYMDFHPPSIDYKRWLAGAIESDQVPATAVISDSDWDATPCDAELDGYNLIDFGSAQWLDKPPTAGEFSSYALRAPELILRSGLSEKVDIWALGCMTLELLTGPWAFDPKPHNGLSTEADHLLQMVELTGEKFGTKFLSSERTKEFFNGEGNLLYTTQSDETKTTGTDNDLASGNAAGIHQLPAQLIARLSECLFEADVMPAAEFVAACLRLDPADRMSAEKLLSHPWLRKRGGCCSVASNWKYVVGRTHSH